MKALAIGAIRAFQAVHPFVHQANIAVFGFSATCRQHPSCSQYTIQQIQEHGTITGLKSGFKRIVNCKHV
jgi:putative component of membrane protein insertase Oxa1/YidC/SpoIIIJ protein YidD